MSSVASHLSSTAAAVSSAAVSPSPTARATPQGGILEGSNPSVYDPKNPIFLFIIQAGIILIFCRLLHWPLSKLRQPRVIAEVLGGIILGPSVMMRIPGFQNAIFPAAAMPNLNLVANLGLVLFLFLVGLEVNVRLFMSNWRVALSVGLAGMMLPFGLGCAIAWGLYNQFHNEPGTIPITFPVYMLFIGTALAITAFPVLCRILTELKLLSTPVGVTVLAAGVGNDVVGWILLALCVALVNNGSGIVALYVLLCCVGWGLFLVFAIRPAFVWLLRRSGAIQNGPSQTMVALTLLIVLTSAWFTGIIGVHPIFGAFMVGVICPHEGGFAIKVTEKIEDLVSSLFLPLYFALSGLSTNLGLLNNGITWGYVVAVIVLAFAGKIIGGTLAAKACKLVWRESFSIGVLMSCKGLVELIVLNIGLQAKILSQKTFTIFVVMALVTTVATTPLTTALYPPWYQKKLEAWKRGEIDWDGNPLDSEGREVSEESLKKAQEAKIRHLLVYLNLEGLPSLFTFIALLGGDRPTTVSKVHRSKLMLPSVPEDVQPSANLIEFEPKRPLEVHGLRLVELTDRTSSVMQVAETEGYGYSDPVINTFRTFAQLHNVAASGSVSVVPESSYAETLATLASDYSSDLVLVPWSEGAITSDSDAESEHISMGAPDAFIQKVLEKATCNTAVFVNRGFGAPSAEGRPSLMRTISGLSRRSHQETPLQPIADRSHHVYFPFFGGVDDRAALRFVLQLAQNSNITVTIIHFSTKEGKTPATVSELLRSSGSRLSGMDISTSGRVDRESLIVEATQDTTLIHLLRDTLPEELTRRVVFVEIPTTTPVADALSHARQELAQMPRNAGDLVVVGRGNHASISSEGELTTNAAGAEMRKTLGIVAEAMVSGGVRGSVLVLQAGGRGLEG